MLSRVSKGAKREHSRFVANRRCRSLAGVTHNIPLLRDVLTNQRFVSGKYSTKLLPEDYPEGFKGLKMTPEKETELLAVAALVYARRDVRDKTFIVGGGQIVLPTEWDVYMTVKGEDKHVLIKKAGDGYEVSIDGGKAVKVAADWAVESPLIKAKFTGADGKETEYFTQYLDALPVGFRLSYHGSKVGRRRGTLFLCRMFANG